MTLTAYVPDVEHVPLSEIRSTEVSALVDRLLGDAKKVGVAAFQASI